MKHNYLEIEDGLKNLLEHNNTSLYFESLVNLFLTVETFQEFEQAIIVFINAEKQFNNYKKSDYRDLYLQIIELIQQKFIYLSKTKQKQTKFITSVFYLFEILAHLSSISIDIYSSELDSIKQNYLQQYSKAEYSSSLQFFASDLVFICDILNQNKDGFKEYLKRLMISHVHIATKFSIPDFIFKYITYFKIDFEVSLLAMKELFDETEYFKLPALQRRSIFNWAFHGMWSSIPQYLGHRDWMKLYEPIKNIMFKHFEKDQIDEGMYTQFFLWHIMGNNYQTQEEFKKFNDEINKPLEKYYGAISKKYQLIDLKKSPKEKINIALVKDRIDNTSPTQVELGLIKRLMQNKNFTDNYILTVYSCNYFEKSIDNESIIKKFNELGIEVINPNKHIINEQGYYHNHFEDAIRLRESIIENNTEIMIVAVSTFPAIDFLFTNRTASKQIYWSHGNYTYTVEGIDKKITHGIFDNKVIDKGFEKFTSFLLPCEMETYDRPVEESLVLSTRDKFPKDMIILGSIGRLVKLNSDKYLNLVIEILQKFENTIYIACGSGETDNIKKQLPSSIKERFYFTGQINPHLYGHIIDIFLDTFPLEHGNSKWEFVSKNGGKPLVMLKTKNNESLIEFFLEKGFLKDNIAIADTTLEYKQYVEKLISSENYRKKVSEVCYYVIEDSLKIDAKSFIKVISN